MPVSQSNMEPAVFRDVCSRFASGVTVTTVMGSDGKPHGLTASSFTAVSLRPPLILICIDHNSGVLHHFRTASHFAVNILSADQSHISNQFAMKSIDRFDGIDWTPGISGAPLLDRCLAQVECVTQQIVDAGDHAVFFGEVIGAKTTEDQPLLYFDRNYRSLKEDE
jgi:flavin reductase (DIM6/NTAB) family NADH-FMN oxidoreductase RutF